MPIANWKKTFAETFYRPKENNIFFVACLGRKRLPKRSIEQKREKSVSSSLVVEKGNVYRNVFLLKNVTSPLVIEEGNVYRNVL